ncbi:MAG: hypothetical protein ACP5IB_06615, partial [Thermoplasmata archaeon]
MKRRILLSLLLGFVFMFFAKGIFSDWYQITITNTQSTPTPSPFQQEIAICNGTVSLGNNFAYVNNPTLFNLINANGSNVYFTTINGGSPNIYS